MSRIKTKIRHCKILRLSYIYDMSFSLVTQSESVAKMAQCWIQHCDFFSEGNATKFERKFEPTYARSTSSSLRTRWTVELYWEYTLPVLNVPLSVVLCSACTLERRSIFSSPPPLLLVCSGSSPWLLFMPIRNISTWRLYCILASYISRWWGFVGTRLLSSLGY